MGYRRSLLGRWSARDRLAVLVVAVTVAFLVGSVLLVFAAERQVTSIADEFESPGSAAFYDTPGAARAAASSGAVVLPVSAVTLPDGSTATVVGVPPGSDLGAERRAVQLRASGADAGPTWGTLDPPTEVALSGPDGTVTVEITPPDPRASPFPPAWIVSDGDTVRRLGPTGALVLTPDVGPAGGQGRTPLLAALSFFLAGTGQVLALLGVVIAGVAVLIGVTAFSVTRMSVRDRLRTVRIVRSTGGRPRDVLGLFALRAGLLTAVGAALGYAFGVILTRGAVNVAIAVGLPTSLAIHVTPRAVGVIVPALLGTVAVGTAAGVVAAWPAARRAPAHLTGTEERSGAARPAGARPHRGPEPHRGPGAIGSRLTAALSPTLIGWRALVPSAATLAAFVAFVALVAAMAGVAAPLTATDGATVLEPGSTHPVSSQVPVAYAEALRVRGIDASAEILLFEVVDGHPVPARGANYTAFANVTDAHLVRGNPPGARRAARPGAPPAAVIGLDMARTLGVDVGDTLTLGGSTRVALTRVKLVGVFTAPGPFDDQLVVPLATARHLSTVGAGKANVVRADRLPDRSARTAAVGVVDVRIPETVVANRSFPVEITVRNDAQRERSPTVTARFRGQSRRISPSVPATSSRTVTVRFAAGPPARSSLQVGNVTVPVRILDPDAVSLRALPDRAPPDSEPLVRVVNATGRPVPGATVTATVTRGGGEGDDGGGGGGGGSGGGGGGGGAHGTENASGPAGAGNRTTVTGPDGYTRVPLGEPGTYTVTARRDNHTARTTLTVTRAVSRLPTAGLTMSPTKPSLLTRPTVRIALFNPWNRTVSRSVTLAAPGGPFHRSPTLGPGERTTLTVRPARQPPGEYDLRVHTANATLATATYRVTGDERVVSALASSGRRGSTAIGRAIQVAFGNLRLVLGALLALAALMTVGATTATFAQAVQARRRTVGIRRATGADPASVLRLVLADAARIGLVATALALVVTLGALRALGAAGYLAVFGVRLSPAPPPAVLVATAGAGLGLTLLGAGLATAGLLVRPPGALVGGGRVGRGEQVRRGTRTGRSEPPGGDTGD